MEYAVRLLLEQKYYLHISLAFLGQASEQKLKEVQQDIETLFVEPIKFQFEDQYAMLGAKNDIRVRKCHPTDPKQREKIRDFYQMHNVQEQWMIEQKMPVKEEPLYHMTVKKGSDAIVAALDMVDLRVVDIKPLGPHDPCYTWHIQSFSPFSSV